MKKLYALFLFFWVTGAAASPSYEAIQEAYIVGYPLVVMDLLRQQMTSKNIGGLPRAPVNHFVHEQQFPNAASHIFTNPNVDTLFSSAWVDLAQGPILFTLPVIEERYYIFELLDGWSDLIDSISSHTKRTEATTYAIVGPKWAGELPKGVVKITSSTSFLCILGRIQSWGASDYAKVHELQNQIRLMPLNQLQPPPNNPPSTPSTPALQVTLISKDTEIQQRIVKQIEQMEGMAFFSHLAQLIQTVAPLTDENVVKKMQFLESAPHFIEKQRLNKAAKEANHLIATAWKKKEFAIRQNGWVMLVGDLGQYGENYLVRAAVAYGGVGSNLPHNTVNAFVDQDEDGNALQANGSYRIHFNHPPPTEAFWSLTLYDANHFFVPNPLNRYALSSYSPLKTQPGGGFDIYLQKSSPTGEESNWLPLPPTGSFNLILRLYQPKQTVIDGTWKTPPIEKIQTKNSIK